MSYYIKNVILKYLKKEIKKIYLLSIKSNEILVLDTNNYYRPGNGLLIYGIQKIEKNLIGYLY